VTLQELGVGGGGKPLRHHHPPGVEDELAQLDNPTDAELDPAANERLVRPRQARRQRPYVVDCYHGPPSTAQVIARSAEALAEWVVVV
jgi:hypothetical protein